MKSTRASGMPEETRQRGGGAFAARSRVLARLASLNQMETLTRKLQVVLPRSIFLILSFCFFFLYPQNLTARRFPSTQTCYISKLDLTLPNKKLEWESCVDPC